LFLLQALKMLDDKNAHLVIVDGRLRPERVYAKDLVEKMGLSGRVSFFEKITREDLILEYNRAEVACCPSLFEGFGLPALEAMACGTALIAGDAGALPEVVGRGDEAGGLLVRPADEKALAEKLAMLLSDETLRSAMGQKARLRAEKYFSWGNVAEKVENIYREEIEKGRNHNAR
jgi:glycosyltransferase involved in cell wall biosynthesis